MDERHKKWLKRCLSVIKVFLAICLLVCFAVWCLTDWLVLLHRLYRWLFP